MAKRSRPPIKPAKGAPAPERPTGAAYLESTPRIATILGAFAVLAIPLALLQLSTIPTTTKFAISVAYAILIGGTHFLITLAVYFHGRNLQYFASSPSNIVVYFVTPAAILTLFFVIGFFGLNADRPNASLGFVVYVFLFTVAVRGLDFLHVVRQSFGMLQLFKGQARGAFPPWMRRADNAFFLSMAGLQLSTFVHGARTGSFVFSLGAGSGILLAIAVVSFAGVMAGFAAASSRVASRKALLVPLTYFFFQGASASLAVMRTELYTASLAMHYVEYHVVIFPRLFRFELDSTSRADRLAAWTRRHKFVFYGALAGLAFFISPDLLPLVGQRVGSTGVVWLLFNILSGIFVTHYFIEAFIWKFRNPYYRESLGPLYFPQRARSQSQSA